MSLIVKRPWTRQPQVAVGVDPGAPLSKSLLRLYNFAAPRDVITGLGVTTSSNPSSGVNSSGQGLRFSYTTPSSYLFDKQGITAITTAATVAVVASFSDINDNAPLFGITDGTWGLVGLYTQWTTKRVGVFVRTAAGLNSVFGTTNCETNKPIAIVGTYDGAFLRIYVNGVLEGSSALTGALVADSSNIYNLGGSGKSTGIANMGAVWNRAIGQNEAAEFSRNPWQLFAPLPRRIWAPTGSTGTTGTGASTQATNTSDASGTVLVSGTGADIQAANTSATSGTVAVSGAATDTQAGNTSAATGTVDAGVTGTAAVTQASNTSASSGTVAVSGAGTTAQAVNVSAGTGTVATGVTGTASVTQAANVSAASGAASVTGAAASTQTNGVTAGAGTVLVSGSAADTQAANTSAASGTVISGVAGTGASTQAGNTSAAAGTVALSATAASTQALNTTAATGATSITGTAAQAQAANTSAGTGTVATGVTGSASVTQAANVSAASGTVTVTGTAASTQANGVSAASGSVGNSVGVTVLVQDITSLLATLVPAGGVFYAVNTTEPPVYPYIVWQRVAGTPLVALSGAADLQNTRIQVDVYSRQVSEAVAFETAIEAAFSATSIVNVPLSSQDFYEPDTRAMRVSKDYSVWARN